MKRFLSISLITLALLLSVAGAFGVGAHAAYAQTADGAPPLSAPALTDPTIIAPTLNLPTTPTVAEMQAAAETPTPPNLESDSYGPVLMWIMSKFAALAGIAMITLNYAMYYTVLSMGKYVHDLTAVGVTWQILRDIGNIALIFGFLATGLAIILNMDIYGDRKKLIPNLIIAAVLLNFSLFAAEAVVDVGNLFATQFYKQISGGTLPTSDTLNDQGISGIIMSQLGIQSLYNLQETEKAQQIFKGSTPSLVAFMAIILFIVLAFVLFSLAFILIARFVILLFLIIIAPIGFAGLAVPKLESTARWWWNKLLRQTITAPVLLLLLYIALSVITDAHFLTGFNASNDDANWIGIATNNVGAFAPVFLSFVVAMGVLLAVVYVSKEMSTFGGDWATRMGGRLSFGVTAWAGRRTIGRGAYYAARGLRQSKGFNKFDAWTGRATTRLLDKGAKGSFDIRGIKASGGLKGIGFDPGAASKGGFAEDRKKSIKEHQEAVKQIEEAFKDKGPKRFEEQVRADRAVALYQAEENKKMAQEAQVKAKAEIDRINKLPTNEQTLAELQKAEQDLATADNQFKDADKKLTKAKEEMTKDVEKAAEDMMKANIKLGKTAYAEALTKWGNNWYNPFNYIGYGPSTSAAARKIKESFKDKSTAEKIADLAKKDYEENRKKESTEGGAESAKSKEEGGVEQSSAAEKNT